ncbi:MAG: hypothetical protein E7302_01710 [Butyrivibrio sp.]|nr:hypothetical protein [Butyrivibrio sp.]
MIFKRSEKGDSKSNSQSSKRFGMKSISTLAITAFAVMLLWTGGISVSARTKLPTGDMDYIPKVRELNPPDVDEDDKDIFKPSAVNANLVTGIHYDYLSSDEKLLYKAIYEAVSDNKYVPYSQRANAGIQSVYSQYLYTLDTGSSAPLDGYGETEMSYLFNRASEAVYYDNPAKVEFYMVYLYGYYFTSNGRYMNIIFVAKQDDTQFAAYDTAITGSLNTIKGTIEAQANGSGNGTWAAVKELYAHDYYCKDYDLKYDHICANTNGDAGYFDYAHTAYGSLVDKSAVCDGYSTGFRLIMKELNVNAMVITGDAGTLGGHAWNIVQLDGNWYEVDTTWDDNDPEVAPTPDTTLIHDYFNETTAKYTAGIRGGYHWRTANNAYSGFRMPVAKGIHWTYTYINAGNYSADTTVFVSSINVNSSVELDVGGTATLNVNVLPSNATNKAYVLTSMDPTVVSVSNNTIKGLKAGSTTVVVASAEDENIYASCQVTVKAVKVTGISIQQILTLNCGESANIVATIKPANAGNQLYTLKSSNTNIVTVNGNTVTAVGVGSCSLIARSVEGGYIATCAVTVNGIPVVGISIPESITLNINETEIIEPIIEPANATNKEYTLISSDPAIVAVEGNTIKGVAAGTATITATTADGGFNAVCTVTVTISKNTEFTVAGNTYKITGKDTAALVGSTKTSISIPATFKKGGVKFKVTSVGDNAFAKNKKITSITGGKNLTSIGKNAFSECSKLKKFSISSTKVTKIGAKAFYKCGALATFNMNINKLSSIGGSALSKISAKAKITLAASTVKKYNKAVEKFKKAGAKKATYTKKK